MTIDQEIDNILALTHTIAVVGASEKPHRDSHRVMSFLQFKGYRVIPVNPRLTGQTLLGETVYASLKDIPDRIDMVDIFRRSEMVPEVVNDALHTDAGTIWMQLGVINEEAAKTARNAGLTVIMDHCPKLELERRGR
ncbi:CoA-binding protein [Hahella ganghwensis]|uniref:CoA-binding protein n=1 Tax=Hahella ganghwensis TaxID=286420 RepID=UPI00037E2955|nr:CoA-binding protein [Hahella ganghwensis]